MTTLASVHHDGSPRYVRPVKGGKVHGLAIGDEVAIRARAGREAPVDRVLLRTCPDGEQAFVEMKPAEAEAGCRWWEATLRLTEPVVSYRFALLTSGSVQWLNGSGMHESTPTDAEDFRLVAGSPSPEWLDDAVFFQIFPDRFCDGDPSTDVADGAWSLRGAAARRKRWDEPPGTGLPALVEFYGGDLPGIEARLDYLQDLGVNALYLTPIFETRSNHGYDTIDYRRIAAHFGGDRGLASLRRATRERGMRLVLDIALNHVGAEHPWFLAAQADATAPTAEFFAFVNHPHDYESWLGHRSLVKLDYRSRALRDEMYRGPNAAVRQWLRPPYSIDGWRLDVANMLGRLGAAQLNAEVAREIRAAVKAENPDAYLLGENWFDATPQLMGDQWDGVMNYAGFTNPLLQWLSGVRLGGDGADHVLDGPPLSTRAFVGTLDAFRAAIPWRLAGQQLLLLGSHDTARIASVLEGNPAHQRLAFGLLMTYPGVPCIFYGDEIGLTGETSLAARRTMPWDTANWDRERLDLVRLLIGLRRSSPALRHGGFQALEVAADSVVFLRDAPEEAVIVVANRGPSDRPARGIDAGSAGIADGTGFTEVLSGARADVAAGRLELPATPPGVAIWQAALQA